MNELECKAYALRLAGHNRSESKLRLLKEGHGERAIDKALDTVDRINQDALPVPQITAHYERLSNGKVKWWQDNWSSDEWGVIDPVEFEYRRHILMMTYHKVVEGMPEK